MKPVLLADIIPIFVALESEAVDKIIKADIINPLTADILNADVVLDYVVGTAGHYINSTISMPPIANLEVVYKIYDTDGITLLFKDSEDIFLASPGTGAATGTDKVTDMVIGEIDGQT
jgi:hypothetical protein